MQPNPSNAAAPVTFNPALTGQTLVEAQQTAMVMAAKLSALAFKYALELNKIGFEIWQRQAQHSLGLTDTLTPRQTPQEVVSAHAELIEQATQDYQDGVQRIAHAGTQMVGETAQTLDEGREHAEALIEDIASQHGPNMDSREHPNGDRSSTTG